MESPSLVRSICFGYLAFRVKGCRFEGLGNFHTTPATFSLSAALHDVRVCLNSAAQFSLPLKAPTVSVNNYIPVYPQITLNPITGTTLNL